MKATAPLLLVAIFPAAAHALGLGDAMLRSPLGQPLDARIALITNGEAVTGECFSVLATPSPASGLAPSEGIELMLERVGSRMELRASTRLPVREPYVAFTVRASCPGYSGGTVEKSYALLPDPPRAAAEPAPAIAAPRTIDERPLPSPSRVATSRLREGGGAAPSRANRRQAAAGTATSPAFTLRLSTSTLPAGTGRAGWRERLRDVEADDRTAEILQLKRTVELLDARVASLQLKLAQASQLQPAQPAATAAVAAAPSDTRWMLPVLLSALLGAAAGYLGARRAARREDARDAKADSSSRGLHRLYGIETGQWVAMPPTPVPSRPAPRGVAATAGRPRGSPASTATAR